MGASETPQQGRPTGAERLHMAFHGLFTDQESGAWMPRADKAHTPSRCSVTTASTRASVQSARTPNAPRRNTPGPHYRLAMPADHFISPIRAVRKVYHGVKSPVAPQSFGTYANRHPNRSVYTAVGISTPRIMNVPHMAKLAHNPAVRASGSSVSPHRQRRSKLQSQQQPQQQPVHCCVKPSPMKGQPAGSTTAAVIAALAMDADLPELDPTAVALLESIMASCGPPSSCNSPAFEAPSATSGRSPAGVLGRSPLSPSAAKSTFPLPAGAATGFPLTPQVLQQCPNPHPQQLRYQYQQQAMGILYAAAPGGVSSSGDAAAGADPTAWGGRPGPQQQHQSHQMQLCGLQASAQTPPQSQSQLGSGGTGGFSGWGAAAGRSSFAPLQPTLGSVPSQPAPALSEQYPVLPPQLQELLRPPPSQHRKRPSQRQLLQHQQPQTSALENVLTTREISGGAAAAVGAAVAQDPTRRTPGEEPLPGSLPSKVIWSPRAVDESQSLSRRPNTYVGLQGAARMHNHHFQSHDQPISPRAHLTHHQVQQLLQQQHQQPQTADPDVRLSLTTLAPRQLASSFAATQVTDTDDHLEPIPRPYSPILNADDSRCKTPTREHSVPVDGRTPFPRHCSSDAVAAAATSLDASSSSRDTAHSNLPHPTSSNGRLPPVPGLLLPETIAEIGSASESRSPRSQRVSLTSHRGHHEHHHGHHGQERHCTTHLGDRGTALAADQPTAAAPRRGLFGGLFACFGFSAAEGGSRGNSSMARGSSRSPARNARSPTVRETCGGDASPLEDLAPQSPLTSYDAEAVLHVAAVPSPMEAAAAAVVPAAVTAIPITSMSTVAAVAAALSISPTSAAAHVGADSRLLMLLQAELARLEPAASPSAAVTVTSTSGHCSPSPHPVVTATAAAAIEGFLPNDPQQQSSNAASSQMPRTSYVGGAVAGGGGRGPPETAPQSSNPCLQSGDAAPQLLATMTGSPDAPTPIGGPNLVGRSPVGHPLHHEDGDSVLRGSVDVPTAASMTTSLTFSPTASSCRQQPLSRGLVPNGGGGALPRRPRQPLQAALEAEAAVQHRGSGHSLLQDQAPKSPSPPLCSHSGLVLECSGGMSPACHWAHCTGDLTSQQVAGTGEVPCPGYGTPVGAVGVSFSEQSTPLGSSTPQTVRSSRKRTRATHAGFGGSALSQLDARKLAALPLEEMLEQIQAAIAAEDLAVGRSKQQQHGDGSGTASGGGMSDKSSVLPMPPVVAKARSGSLRRRKSTAGGRTTGAGQHSGGGGGGNPSRGGGRSSDGSGGGGVRGGGGVGAVQTTLMKAATVTAAVGTSGRRRRRVKKRSSPAAETRRRQAQVQQIVPAAPSSFQHGSQAGTMLSSTARKSDGSCSYGMPVWRHGGRALVVSGGAPASNTSPGASLVDATGLTRQLSHKKPQVSTPGAASSPPASGSYMVGGGGVLHTSAGGGRSSPPRLRSSAPAAQNAAVAAATSLIRTPALMRTPSRGAQVAGRSARRMLDVEEAGAARPLGHLGHGSVLSAISSGLKSATLAAATTGVSTEVVSSKKAAPPPVTSSLRLSDLLTRFKISVMPSPVMSVSKVGTPAATTDGTSSPPTAPLLAAPDCPRYHHQQQQNEGASDYTICRSTGGSMGGAPRMAASPGHELSQLPEPRQAVGTGIQGSLADPITSVHLLQHHRAEATLCSVEQAGTAGLCSNGGGGGAGCDVAEFTSEKPGGVSLTELLLRAAVPEKQPLAWRSPAYCSVSNNSGGGSRSSMEVGLHVAQESAELKPNPFLEQKDLALSIASDDADVLTSALPKASLLSKYELHRTSMNAAITVPSASPSASAAVSAGGGSGCSRGVGPRHEPAEHHVAAAVSRGGAVSYLELLQTLNHSSGGRAVAVGHPIHTSGPMSTRALSGACGSSFGGGCSAGGMGRNASMHLSPHPASTGGHSSSQSPTWWRPIGCSSGGKVSQSIGSYTQLMMRPANRSASAASAVTVTTITAQRLDNPAVTSATEPPQPPPQDVCDMAFEQTEGSRSYDFAAEDVVSVTGSQVHIAGTQVAQSLDASSVVAQLPSASGATDAEAPASTATICSDGMRLLADTADSQDRRQAQGDESEGDVGCLATARGGGEPGCQAVDAAIERQQEEKAEDDDAEEAMKGADVLKEQDLEDADVVRAKIDLPEEAKPVKQESASCEEEFPWKGEMPSQESTEAKPLKGVGMSSNASARLLELPALSTRKTGGTPFADWRCVPLEAYDAAFQDFDPFLEMPTYEEVSYDPQARCSAPY